MNSPISDEDDEYAVGYGKPPKHTRFQKGRSGNPHGRPKKNKVIGDLLEEALQVEVVVNGKKVTKKELLACQIVNDAIKGKASARNLLMLHMRESSQELEDFDPSEDDKIEVTKATKHYQRKLEEEETLI